MTKNIRPETQREELKKALFGKKKHAPMIVLIVVCLIAAICVGAFFLSRKPESTTGTVRTFPMMPVQATFPWNPA